MVLSKTDLWLNFDELEEGYQNSGVCAKLMKAPNNTWLLGGILSFVTGLVMKISEHYPSHNMYFTYNHNHWPDILWLNGLGFAFYSLLDAVEENIKDHNH